MDVAQQLRGDVGVLVLLLIVSVLEDLTNVLGKGAGKGVGGLGVVESLRERAAISMEVEGRVSVVVSSSLDLLVAHVAVTSLGESEEEGDGVGVLHMLS